MKQVLAAGEFAVRGGIIDVFPMGSDRPFRLDLFDEEIDEIRWFDIETQRSAEKVDEIRLLPGREFPVNAEALASAVHFNMDAEDLTSLMESYANASQLTYDNNLQTLGYATEDDPAAIQIYPKDFEAKEQVLASIDAYNERQRAAGNEDGVITYTDYMGIIMGSVTDIVNMISLVLIAFVSISLVVSSIMIGIITYISVLERKKEIGILRAIGASKRNVASVFNAETFIEGLISGLFAIAVVVVVSVPVNAWVLADFDVEGIMNLPAGSAAVLVCISVVLTLVAGLIPSSAASRRDPVEALRSE